MNWNGCYTSAIYCQNDKLTYHIFFQKCKGSDFLGLEEMAVISVMCNDSAIDFNEYKNAFEKVGEATETALIVLAEKVNPYDIDKRGGRLESAKAVR